MKLHGLLLSLVFIASCGGSDSTDNAKKAETKTAKTAAPAKPAPAKPVPAPEPEPEPELPIVVDDGKVATVNITANDIMKFNTAQIDIAAGRTVKLTLKHVGKMPTKMMGHNFVLLAQGTDVDAFTAAGVTAQDTDFIAKSMDAKVLAKTKMLGGGESDTIEFKAPAPGTYDFICTFPGHATLMKGKLIVSE